MKKEVALKLIDALFVNGFTELITSSEDGENFEVSIIENTLTHEQIQCLNDVLGLADFSNIEMMISFSDNKLLLFSATEKEA